MSTIRRPAGLLGRDRAIHPRMRSNFIQSENSDLAQFLQTALRLRGELANRFQIIAEQFEPIWRISVGRKHIDDPAAAGKFAGILDSLNALVAAFDEPGG